MHRIESNSLTGVITEIKQKIYKDNENKIVILDASEAPDAGLVEIQEDEFLLLSQQQQVQ